MSRSYRIIWIFALLVALILPVDLGGRLPAWAAFQHDIEVIKSSLKKMYDKLKLLYLDPDHKDPDLEGPMGNLERAASDYKTTHDYVVPVKNILNDLLIHDLDGTKRKILGDLNKQRELYNDIYQNAQPKCLDAATIKTMQLVVVVALLPTGPWATATAAAMTLYEDWEDKKLCARVNAIPIQIDSKLIKCMKELKDKNKNLLKWLNKKPKDSSDWIVKICQVSIYSSECMDKVTQLIEKTKETYEKLEKSHSKANPIIQKYAQEVEKHLCEGTLMKCILSPDPVELDASKRKQKLKIKVMFDTGLTLAADPKDFKLNSWDEGIATVSADGVVSAVSTGETYVEAVLSEINKRCTVEVIVTLPTTTQTPILQPRDPKKPFQVVTPTTLPPLPKEMSGGIIKPAKTPYYVKRGASLHIKGTSSDPFCKEYIHTWSLDGTPIKKNDLNFWHTFDAPSEESYHNLELEIYDPETGDRLSDFRKIIYETEKPSGEEPIETPVPSAWEGGGRNQIEARGGNQDLSIWKRVWNNFNRNWNDWKKAKDIGPVDSYRICTGSIYNRSNTGYVIYLKNGVLKLEMYGYDGYICSKGLTQSWEKVDPDSLHLVCDGRDAIVGWSMNGKDCTMRFRRGASEAQSTQAASWNTVRVLEEKKCTLSKRVTPREGEFDFKLKAFMPGTKYPKIEVTITNPLKNYKYYVLVESIEEKKVFDTWWSARGNSDFTNPVTARQLGLSIPSQEKYRFKITEYDKSRKKVMGGPKEQVIDWKKEEVVETYRPDFELKVKEGDVKLTLTDTSSTHSKNTLKVYVNGNLVKTFSQPSRNSFSIPVKKFKKPGVNSYLFKVVETGFYPPGHRLPNDGVSAKNTIEIEEDKPKPVEVLDRDIRIRTYQTNGPRNGFYVGRWVDFEAIDSMLSPSVTRNYSWKVNNVYCIHMNAQECRCQFKSPGTYTVEVEVDAYDNFNKKEIKVGKGQIRITVIEDPTRTHLNPSFTYKPKPIYANIYTSKLETIKVGSETIKIPYREYQKQTVVTFTAESYDPNKNNIYSWEINKSPHGKVFVRHNKVYRFDKFDEPGEYEIRLAVKRSREGVCLDEIKETITVLDPGKKPTEPTEKEPPGPPSSLENLAMFEPSFSTAKVGEGIDFKVTSQIDNEIKQNCNFDWYVGAGFAMHADVDYKNLSYDRTPLKVGMAFKEPGEYTVKLRVHCKKLQRTWEHEETINILPAKPKVVKPQVVKPAADRAEITGHIELVEKQSSVDHASQSEALRGDGNYDSHFRLTLSASDRTIKWIEIRNTNSQFSVWDTKPNNNMWLLVVTQNGRSLNIPDGSVRIPMGRGENVFSLYCQDNGSISTGGTSYKFTVAYESGEKYSIPVNLSTGQGTPIPVSEIKQADSTYGPYAFLYQGPIQSNCAPSDTLDNPKVSNLMLYEDGRPLGPAHSNHFILGSTGKGRFSHWTYYLLFSTSDNSDPRTNGRNYSLVCRKKIEIRSTKVKNRKLPESVRQIILEKSSKMRRSPPGYQGEPTEKKTDLAKVLGALDQVTKSQESAKESSGTSDQNDASADPSQAKKSGFSERWKDYQEKRDDDHKKYLDDLKQKYTAKAEEPPKPTSPRPAPKPEKPPERKPAPSGKTLTDITVDSDTITISFWDHGQEDGDIIDIMLNDKILRAGIVLKKAPESFSVKLPSGKNIFGVRAVNEGSVSPNTATVKFSNVTQGKDVQVYKIKSGQKTDMNITVGMAQSPAPLTKPPAKKSYDPNPEIEHIWSEAGKIKLPNILKDPYGYKQGVNKLSQYIGDLIQIVRAHKAKINSKNMSKLKNGGKSGIFRAFNALDVINDAPGKTQSVVRPSLEDFYSKNKTLYRLCGGNDVAYINELNRKRDQSDAQERKILEDTKREIRDLEKEYEDSERKIREY